MNKKGVIGNLMEKILWLVVAILLGAGVYKLGSSIIN